PERKLIGTIVVPGDAAGPLTIRLKPWATITGRVVDRAGRPQHNLIITGADGAPGPVRRGIVGGVERTDRDGRFRLEGLVPGTEYSFEARSTNGREVVGQIGGQRPVRAGAVRDLGEIRIFDA